MSSILKSTETKGILFPCNILTNCHLGGYLYFPRAQISHPTLSLDCQSLWPFKCTNHLPNRQPVKLWRSLLQWRRRLFIRPGVELSVLWLQATRTCVFTSVHCSSSLAQKTLKCRSCQFTWEEKQIASGPSGSRTHLKSYTQTHITRAASRSTFTSKGEPARFVQCLACRAT